MHITADQSNHCLIINSQYLEQSATQARVELQKQIKFRTILPQRSFDVLIIRS